VDDYDEIARTVEERMAEFAGQDYVVKVREEG
jgi:hypothetical protein